MSSVGAPWVFDSEASFQVTSDSSCLTSCRPIVDGICVHTADGTPCKVTHKGTLSISQFAISDVFLAPKLSMNLMSVADKNYLLDLMMSLVMCRIVRARGSLELAVVMEDPHPSMSLTPCTFLHLLLRLCFSLLNLCRDPFCLFLPPSGIID